MSFLIWICCGPLCSGVWCAGFSGLSHSALSVVSDAAFLAREKAKADAEYYTAAKFAEANTVKRNSADAVWQKRITT